MAAPPILDFAVAGGVQNVGTGSHTATILLPNTASDYVIYCQSNQQANCWLSGINGPNATLSINVPAQAGAQITFIAFPLGTAGLNSTVLAPGTQSYTFTVQTGYYAIPIVSWNTQVYYQLSGNTYTFFFSFPPGVESNFSYMVVGPGQNTSIQFDPIAYGAGDATVASVPPVAGSYLPAVVPSWNTSLSVQEVGPDLQMFFGNPAEQAASTGVLVVQFPINRAVFPLPITATPQQQLPWVVKQLSLADITARLINFFPYPWLSNYATVIGGTAYAIFQGAAIGLNYISGQLYYAWTACRLQTATDTELDLFAQDYFGNELPRLPGESDASYRTRIQTLLLQPRVTRQAIINAIQFFLPGTQVRVLEPWNAGDTGGYGVSYYDYDTQEIPSVYGDPALRYTSYLEITLPPATDIGYNVYGYDLGAAYDAFTGYYLIPIQESQTQIGQLNNLILQLIAQGTQVFVKYVEGTVIPYTTGGSISLATGTDNFNIQVSAISGFYGLFVQLSRPINIWQRQTQFYGFTVNTAVPTPSGTILNYLAVENGVPGFNIAAITAGDTNYTVSSVDATQNVVIPCAQWNTNVYYTGRSSAGLTFEFSDPPSAGQILNYIAVHVSSQAKFLTVTPGQTTAVVGLIVNTRNIPFAVPNWNTTVGVLPDPVSAQVTLTFGTPAPAGGGELMLLSYNT